jgi:hypothetical protein
VRSEQVRLLYRNAPTALLVNALNAALLVVAVADMVGFRLFLWLAALAAVTLGRAMLVRAYRRSATAPRNPDLWARRYVVGAAMAGMLWGAAGVLIATRWHDGPAGVCCLHSRWYVGWGDRDQRFRDRGLSHLRTANTAANCHALSCPGRTHAI